MKKNVVTVAITGASGIQYAMRLIECLLAAKQDIYLLVSKPAKIVAAMETDWTFPSSNEALQHYLNELFQTNEKHLKVFGLEQWSAPVASGTGISRAMVVCPCTTGTLASIASGQCNNLIDRAADVTLKEQKKLILLPREMPFSTIHLENMLKLSKMGCVIMPPNPGFYYKPSNINDLIDFVVARVLDHLDIEHQLIPNWGY